MTQTSLPWDGKLVGDSGPYTSDRWSAMYRSMSPDTASSAVLWSTTSENLKATISGSAVTISEGSAMVYGRYYNNSAEESFAIPVAATDRTDMIVLRATWGSTKTVRLAYLTGTSGSVTPPTLTQTAGTVWEVPLYEIDALAGTIRRDRRSVWQSHTLVHHSSMDFTTSGVSEINIDNLPGGVLGFHVVLHAKAYQVSPLIYFQISNVTGLSDYIYAVEGGSAGIAEFMGFCSLHKDRSSIIINLYNSRANRDDILHTKASSEMFAQGAISPTRVYGQCWVDTDITSIRVYVDPTTVTPEYLICVYDVKVYALI